MEHGATEGVAMQINKTMSLGNHEIMHVWCGDVHLKYILMLIHFLKYNVVLVLLNPIRVGTENQVSALEAERSNYQAITLDPPSVAAAKSYSNIFFWTFENIFQSVR